ncbi:carboxylic ester hydrolase [Sphaerisporangium krabiense]|uniref:Carboxylic ester hydrolase n=1 Tax=Sphaerisporangium krabiense TaxID=763782 RepID=A0A7W8Z1L5_9ACTN|nr:carboxylesterase family protein [Sphaerisporangium krabiense]MBB5625767.1 para-nitrobenzyl esterase [Sphaerisporangium krabiense]GII62897.1 carboxylic ester hydrolase [Sphaerisporangium krabiense]
MKPKYGLSALVALALLGMMTPTQAASRSAPACAPGTTVATDTGQVCGTTGDGVRSWLGVPYAEPPVGDLRWTPAKRHAPWTDVLQATERGSACPQAGVLGTPSENEDCLKLTIVTPADTGAGGLPVMVEFHGGGFRFGAPGPGAYLAQAGNVVHVGVDYRLGIFGFLSHKALGPHAGNYALSDQQEALRWVRRNIARFGGDPRNVTIFGASAGGSSVCAHTASPLAAGLFQKGIVQSGEYNSLRGGDTTWQIQDCKSALPTQAEAQAQGARFATALKCEQSADVAACLRALPVKTLLDQSSDGLAPDRGTLAPIVDGRILTMSPAEAFVKGKVNRVALMHGVGRDEVQLAPATTPEQYEALVKQQYGSLAPEVFARYPLNRYPEPAPFIAYRTIVADSNSVCPALLNDERLSRWIPVFAFQVDNADAPPLFFLDQTKPNGAYHVSEVPFLYGPPRSDVSANQRTFGTQIVAQWTGFARTGNPTVDGTPLWPRYTHGDPAVMSLVPAGDSVATREIARQHNCAFWNKHAPYVD